MDLVSFDLLLTCHTESAVYHTMIFCHIFPSQGLRGENGWWFGRKVVSLWPKEIIEDYG